VEILKLSALHSGLLCVEHLQTNDALVAPLLRLKDNSCHIDESERVLKDAHKYSELVILYEKKGLHNKGCTLRSLLLMLIKIIFIFSDS